MVTGAGETTGWSVGTSRVVVTVVTMRGALVDVVASVRSAVHFFVPRSTRAALGVAAVTAGQTRRAVRDRCAISHEGPR